ncbi:MAG: hypothetical protein V1903_08735 [Bacteroidota bacterium]
MKQKLRFSLTLFVIVLLAAKPAYSQQSDEMLFYKHLAMSAWNGIYYGLSAVHIAEIQDNKAQVALPIITAGTLALVPLFTNETRTITSNQLLLAGHGQLVGWAHGGALALLINGEDSFDEGKSKLTVGLAALGSIGLGITGRYLANTKEWSEGRAALYRLYGIAAPLTGASISLMFSDDARVVAGSVLITAAGGYLLADRINSWNEFTRGEIRATQALTLMNGLLGVCILADIEPDASPDASFIIPALAIAGGTAWGHAWHKGSNLTPQQGMTTIYAAGLGSLVGVGLAILFNPDDSEFNASYYLLPYATGMATYSFALMRQKSKNAALGYIPADKGSGSWDFALMPQNFWLNNKLTGKTDLLNKGYFGMQPLFSATCTF